MQPAGKPDVDAIFGIPPTVAIEQRTSRGGRKSTVATMTEIHHFLRLLYVKLGTQYCPDCNVAVEPQNTDQIVARLLRERKGEHIGLLAPLVTARKGYYTDLAKWAGARDHSHLRVDGQFIPVAPWPRLDRYKEHTIELPVADVVVDPANEAELRAAVKSALENPGRDVRGLAGQQAARGAGQRPAATTLLGQARLPVLRHQLPRTRSAPVLVQLQARLVHRLLRHRPAAAGLRRETGEETAWNAWYEGEAKVCTQCDGQRLNRVARAVRWRDKSIAELASLPVSDAHTFFTGLVARGREGEIARDILTEIRGRLNFMQEVGLNYLALDRAAPTLSGGEAQRIRLAAQLGSNLQGVCYVLDEPTIGLHPRDNRILLDALARLEGNGNTLVVVEHDDDTIRRASHIIDIGPGAGVRGGRVVAGQRPGPDRRSGIGHRPLPGPAAQSPAARPPPGRGRHAHDPDPRRAPAQPAPCRRADPGGPAERGDRRVRLGQVHAGARSAAGQPDAGRLARQAPGWAGCDSITGWEAIDRVLEVDQTPIGKTPRSCPPPTWASGTTCASSSPTREARMRGWTSARFSFNTGDGRCPICEGQGMRTIEMNFLPDVKVPCDACNGARFNQDTLSVQMRGKNAGELLSMEVDDAIGYFAAHPKIHRPLQLMRTWAWAT